MARGKGYQEFPPDDIKEMFTMRAKNSAISSIADRFGTSTWTVTNILYRRVRKEVEIPNNVLQRVNDMKLSMPTLAEGRAPKRRAAKRVSTNGDTLEQAMADYTIACRNIATSKARCIKFGIDKDTLELIRENIRDHA